MDWRTLPLAVIVTGTLAACSHAGMPFEEGVSHYRDGQYLAAKDAFSEAVAIEPRWAASHANRGVARARLGDLNGAIRDYNRALGLTPDDPEIYFNRGNALVAVSHYDLAAADFSRAVELAPTFARALFNRGTMRVYLGDVDGGRADWRRAVEVESDPWVRSAMRRALDLDVATATWPGGMPTSPLTVAPPPPPGTASASVPADVPPTHPEPAVAVATVGASSPSALVLDARGLAARAVTRELDGDRAGAIQDLRAARSLEADPTRRATFDRLLRALEGSR